MKFTNLFYIPAIYLLVGFLLSAAVLDEPEQQMIYTRCFEPMPSPEVFPDANGGSALISIRRCYGTPENSGTVTERTIADQEEDFDEVMKIKVVKRDFPGNEKSSGPRYHTVLNGDSLSRISDLYGVPMARIVSTNHLKSNKIVLGQKLAIPGDSNFGGAASARTSLIHTFSFLRQKDDSSFHWPLPVSGRLTSKFGYRMHPVTKTMSFHNGVDLATPRNTKIGASKQGVVVFAGYRRLSGKTVIIKHSGNLYTMYAHCNRILVKENQAVKTGEIIGLVGMTGRTTGCHLHFSIKNGENYLNPLKYLSK
ncbi:MAG: M23 family metallopeptidase [Candidatus Wallbacteria bacterium]|nr:M23 family metallopeptidase [Candidatus Wallbacteria bacterium]